MLAGGEAPVHETLAHGGIRRAAGTFEEWLRRSCARVRRGYTRAEWEAIVRGPPPFTDRELEIIEARRRFQWKVVGKTPSGKVRLRIANRSSRTLPYLGIGVEGPNPLGAVWVKVGHIKPGTTGLISVDCYREQLDPDEARLFPLPDPEPEDRDRYWEFRT